MKELLLGHKVKDDCDATFSFVIVFIVIAINTGACGYTFNISL